MREILFLSHRIPFPPDRGDKIRSHHILKRLARIAPVNVATFADDDADMAEEVELASLATSYCLIQRRKPLVLAGVEALLRREPVSLAAFRDAAIHAYVRQTLATRNIGAIFVFSGQMGQYVPADFAGRVIVDFVDVDSAKFEAYARKGNRLEAWVHAREARLLRAEEARMASRGDVSTLVSADEVALFASRIGTGRRGLADGRGHADVRKLGNGIDCNFYDASLVTPEPRMRKCAGPRLIFTGQMDYAPNVEAAVRVARRIMPLVRERHPEVTFHVVGRRPTDEVLALDGLHGTRVWGRVDDVRPWLKAADMAICPLEIARGIQNKVLEAMAMGLPVVVSPAAATGIDAVDGHHLVVGASDEALAQAVCMLADAPREAMVVGMAARRFAVERMSWQAALAPLAEIVGPMSARAAAHAA